MAKNITSISRNDYTKQPRQHEMRPGTAGDRLWNSTEGQKMIRSDNLSSVSS